MNKTTFFILILICFVTTKISTQTYENLKRIETFKIGSDSYFGKIGNEKFFLLSHFKSSDFVYNNEVIIDKIEEYSGYQTFSNVYKLNESNELIDFVGLDSLFIKDIAFYEDELYVLGFNYLTDTLKDPPHHRFREHKVYKITKDLDVSIVFFPGGQDLTGSTLTEIQVLDDRLYLGGTYINQTALRGDTLSCKKCDGSSKIIFNVIYDMDKDKVIHFEDVGEHQNDYIYGMAIDEIGNLISVGSYDPYETFAIGEDTIIENITSYAKNGYIYKLDKDGNPIFLKGITSDGRDIVNDVKVDNSGNIYITLFSQSSTSYFGGEVLFEGNTEYYKCHIIKLSPNGDIIWKQVVDSKSESFGARRIELNNGYVELNGSFKDGEVNIDDMVIQGLPQGENTSFLIRFEQENGAYNNSMLFSDFYIFNYVYMNNNVMTMDASGNPSELIVGYEDGEYKSFIVDMIGGFTSIIESQGEDKRLIIYPNPVASSSKLEIIQPNIEQISLYTMEGKLMYTDKIKHRETAIVNLPNLAAGIYILKIDTEKYSFLDKLVVE